MRTPIIVVTIQTAPFALAYLRQQSETGGRYQSSPTSALVPDRHGSVQAEGRPEPRGAGLTDDGGEIDTDRPGRRTGPACRDAQHHLPGLHRDTEVENLELFGTPNPEVLDDDGNPKPEPFHRYTMRQAIEEGFILDVLQNFIEYKVAYELALKTRDSDIKSVDKEAARKAALRWVQLHEYNISQKVALIVEHFREHVSQMLGGAAKAMIVTSSRKAALRYYNAVNRYVARCGYTGVRALVAFSGKVTVEPQRPGPRTRRPAGSR